MKDHFSNRRFLLTLNLSQEDETTLDGNIDHLINKNPFDKAEFMLLIYPM
jgi:16S rRNA (cytidine1402-2'-O)-methyltransferase